jgi:hypothetical protein
MSPEPSPIQNTDEVVSCPVCGALQPGVSIRLLRSVVKRKGRFVAVIDGETMQCLKCKTEWSYGYRSGVFDKHQTYPPNVVSTDEVKSPDGPAPVTRLTPKQRQSNV